MPSKRLLLIALGAAVAGILAALLAAPAASRTGPPIPGVRSGLALTLPEHLSLIHI